MLKSIRSGQFRILCSSPYHAQRQVIRLELSAVTSLELVCTRMPTYGNLGEGVASSMICGAAGNHASVAASDHARAKVVS